METKHEGCGGAPAPRASSKVGWNAGLSVLVSGLLLPQFSDGRRFSACLHFPALDFRRTIWPNAASPNSLESISHASSTSAVGAFAHGRLRLWANHRRCSRSLPAGPRAPAIHHGDSFAGLAGPRGRPGARRRSGLAEHGRLDGSEAEGRLDGLTLAAAEIRGPGAVERLQP